MDDAAAVRGVQGVSEFDGDIENSIELHRLTVDQVFQGNAVEKLHDNEGFAILLANVMDGADVRVIESGCGLRFALEAGKSLRIVGNVVGEKFQGDATMKAGVFGFVNDAHAAAAQPLDNPVVGDGSADE